MKVIRFVKEKNTIMFPDDVWRLIQIAINKGFMLSADDAEEAWKEYSATLHAGWLRLDDKNDDELWDNISSYLEEEQ